MKYAALLTNDAADVERWKTMSEAEAKAAREAELPKWNALFAEIAPYVRYGAELDEPATAKTVRVRNGETLITDGPYAEAKELIGGIFVLECERPRPGDLPRREGPARLARVGRAPAADRESDARRAGAGARVIGAA
ncbi:MAG: hypothetical protein H0W14_03400 [Actinobacteria bacterium]|nr:hypothetical protein [Actinomycetota bacterium]